MGLFSNLVSFLGVNSSPSVQGGAVKCELEREVWKIFEDNLEEDSEPDLVFEIANRFLVGGDFVSCIEAYRRIALTHDSSKGRCEVRLAEVYSKMGSPLKALDCLYASQIHGEEEGRVDRKMWYVITRAVEDDNFSTKEKLQLLNRYLLIKPEGVYANQVRCLITSLTQKIAGQLPKQSF